MTTTTLNLTSAFSSTENARLSKLFSLPDVSVSEPVTIKIILNQGDRVVAICSDFRTRAAVTKTVNKTFNTTLTTSDIYNRLAKRVNQEVVFFATSVNGRKYTTDSYFVGLIAI
mgnify:FL=1